MLSGLRQFAIKVIELLGKPAIVTSIFLTLALDLASYQYLYFAGGKLLIIFEIAIVSLICFAVLQAFGYWFFGEHWYGKSDQLTNTFNKPKPLEKGGLEKLYGEIKDHLKNEREKQSKK